MPNNFKAVVGATLIDGNEGPPKPDTTVLIEGQRIAAVGPSREVAVPDGVAIIEGAGRYMTPRNPGHHPDLFRGGNPDSIYSSINSGRRGVKHSTTSASSSTSAPCCSSDMNT